MYVGDATDCNYEKNTEIKDLSGKKSCTSQNKTWQNFSTLNHTQKTEGATASIFFFNFFFVVQHHSQWSDVMESRYLLPQDELQQACCHSSLTVEEVALPHRCISKVCVLSSCQGRAVGRTQ